MSLSLWRWRQHWFLLLVMGTGMIAAVMLACILPLLTMVLQTAGLRDTLTASSSASELTLHAQTIGLSSPTLNVIDRFASAPLQDHLAAYLYGSPRLEIDTPDFSIISPSQTMFRTPLRLYGNTIDETTPHLVLAQGRLPRSASNDLEIALTPETASALHIRVGGVLTVTSNFSMIPNQGNASNTIQPLDCAFIPANSNTSGISQLSYCHQFKLVVVGLFEVKTNDHFWHGQDFQPVQDPNWHYAALTSTQTLLMAFDQVAASHVRNALYFLPGYYANLTWYYYLDPSRASIERLNDLIDQLSSTQVALDQTNSLIQSSYLSLVQSFDLHGPVLSSGEIRGSLENFRSRAAIASVPVAILTIQIICLLLFFVSLMVELLVERQASAIAMLHSRGASTIQIFGAHITQGLMLGLLALVTGPLLAYVGVLAIARSIRHTSSQNALTLITTNPSSALLNVRWYVLAMVGVIVMLYIAMLYRTSRLYTSNRDLTSGHRSWRPLWQRLNLDLAVAIIALTSYGVSLYLEDIGGLLDAHTHALVSAPVALIAPTFLLLAAVLLFLSFSPLLLRLASRFLSRRRGAVPMLSLTQLSRSPRQAMRMIMLLALATAFATFTLTFSASQAQRVADIAAYQAGADFSGSIHTTALALPLNEETIRYRNITGVIAASAAYVGEELVGDGDALFPLQVRAIDPGTYAQAAIWTRQNSSQPLSSLLSEIATWRNAAIRQGVIPSLVDSSIWNRLDLHPGELFLVHQNSVLSDNIRYLAVAEVQSIPTLTPIDSKATQPLGNVIVDYQTFTTIQAGLYRVKAPANFVWLRTSDDPSALAHIRGVLQSSKMYLDHLNDRRALIDAVQADPLYLNLIIILASGAMETLLLALAGGLLASWLSVRSRLNQFIVLRALGASHRQVVAIMACEQGLVYIISLCLGAGFGALLSITVVPTLELSTLPSIPGKASSDALYIIQQIIQARVTFPGSLGIAFAALVALCATAVTVMALVALRLSMSPMLRLDEERPPLPALREEAAVPAATQIRTAARRPSFPPLTLALGQVRRTWLLFLLIATGIIAAVVMVCAIPLFSTMVTTVDLQTTLIGTPGGSEFTFDASTLGLSTSLVQSIQRQFDPEVQAAIGGYLKQPAYLSIEEKGFTYTPADTPHATYPLKLFAISLDRAISHLTLLKGRLPQATTGTVEVLLTVPTANSLHVTVGSTMLLHFKYAVQPHDMVAYKFKLSELKVRVVGLFQTTSADEYLWHGNTFQTVPGDPLSVVTMLVPTGSLLAAFDRLGSISHARAVFAFDASELLWDYRLDTSRISYSQYSDLTGQLSMLRKSIQNQYGNLQNATQAASSSSYPYLIQASVYDPVYGSFIMLDIVGRYLTRIDVFRIPAAVLTLQVIGLILLFISLMADILVEHQAEAIAVLRSRGASNGQVAACLMTQGIGTGLIALMIGPPLALVVVSMMVQHLLGSPAQGAISLIMSHPVQAILDVSAYALVTVLVIIVVLSLLFRRATGRNILSLRRETARSHRGTVWQHLRLDGGAALIALTAYGLSVYLVRLGDQLDLDTSTLVEVPLTITASIFFLVAIMILFLRFFPFLLRLGARVVMRVRGAASALAFARMARSPSYTTRIMLLPAFAISFLIFTLVFQASQAQRIIDISTYEVGTDFSGDIPHDADRLTIQDEAALYRAIPGVTSVTVGYETQGLLPGSHSNVTMQVMAVDADTFAHTAIWTQQYSSQTLTSLMALLAARREQAIKNRLVPVVVDAAATHELHLGIGALLFIVLNKQGDHPLSCVVVAEVQHIPTINNSADTSSTGNITAPVGILMDYQTYLRVFTANSGNHVDVGHSFLFNHIWLRAQDDPAAVTHVRAMLQIKQMSLDNLYDRHALIGELNNDPLHRTLEAFLLLGAITALLLALLGDLLASWLSMRTRRTQFLVFCALGAAPRQIVGILAWEQGIVLAVAAILGGVFGAILAITAIPSLTFTNITAAGVLGNVSNDEFYALQHVLPTQIIVPPLLNLVLFVLLSIFVLALTTMLWFTQRPSVGHALRLNED
jgi:ABC-type antimicrobial peptide transport system permease subunit